MSSARCATLLSLSLLRAALSRTRMKCWKLLAVDLGSPASTTSSRRAHVHARAHRITTHTLDADQRIDASYKCVARRSVDVMQHEPVRRGHRRPRHPGAAGVET